MALLLAKMAQQFILLIHQSVIYKAKFNLSKENFENITTFYQFRQREDGFPDGMITDSRDNL